MARTFTGTTHVLRNTSVSRTSTSGTISLWINPNWTSGDSAVHAFFQYGDNTLPSNEWPSFQKYSDNNVYIGFLVSGNDDRITVADTGLFVSGVWANHLFTWNDTANEEFYYVNGVQIGTRTSDLVTSSATALSIGQYDASVGIGVNANVSMAEFALWSVVVDAGERAALAQGFSPLLIRTPSLETYYPLLGRDNPETSRILTEALTVTDAGTTAHPRILYASGPHGRRFTTATAAAGAARRGVHLNQAIARASSF